MKLWFVGGALLGAAAVGLGAFGAHALKERLSDYQMQIFETANRYHFYHVFALLFAAFVSNGAAAGFALGIVLFSGSLYLLALTGISWLGAITPIGGTVWLFAWLYLAYAASR